MRLLSDRSEYDSYRMESNGTSVAKDAYGGLNIVATALLHAPFERLCIGWCILIHVEMVGSCFAVFSGKKHTSPTFLHRKSNTL